MSKLDGILDWYTRPVNKEGFLSLRKQRVKDLFLDIIEESEENWGNGTPLCNPEELRKKVEKL